MKRTIVIPHDASVLEDYGALYEMIQPILDDPNTRETDIYIDTLPPDKICDIETLIDSAEIFSEIGSPDGKIVRIIGDAHMVSQIKKRSQFN